MCSTESFARRRRRRFAFSGSGIVWSTFNRLIAHARLRLSGSTQIKISQASGCGFGNQFGMEQRWRGFKHQPETSRRRKMWRDVKWPAINFNSFLQLDVVSFYLFFFLGLSPSGVICKLPRKWVPHTIKPQPSFIIIFLSAQQPRLNFYCTKRARRERVSRTKQMIIINGLHSRINVQKLPEKCSSLKWWFSIFAHGGWVMASH